MILDTDILIWFLRGNPKAKETLLECGAFDISAVTYMELLQGMRDKAELAVMKKFIDAMEINIIPITVDITARAIAYVEMYHLSNSMEMADALIAATCMEKNEILYTGNDKHYRVIDGLQIKIFRP